jgi:membrane protein
MKKNISKKRVVKKEEVGSWVYILLLTSVTILGWVLGKFDFSIGKTTLTIAVFAYPFRYFIANIITKKYGYKETMNGISYSACLLLLFAIVASLLGQHDVDYVPLTGELFGYMLSQMINLSIYYYLLINTKNDKITYLGSYIAAMLVDTLVSMLFASRLVVLASFWKTYFVTILIQAIISIFLIYFDDKKIYNPRKK